MSSRCTLLPWTLAALLLPTTSLAEDIWAARFGPSAEILSIQSPESLDDLEDMDAFDVLEVLEAPPSNETVWVYDLDWMVSMDYPLPRAATEDWVHQMILGPEQVSSLELEGPTLLTYLSSSGAPQQAFDFQLSVQSDVYAWDGFAWQALPSGEPLSLSEDTPVAILPSRDVQTQLTVAYQWEVPAEYEVAMDPGVEALADEPDLLPLFVVGDVNEDGLVDAWDGALLEEWLWNHTLDLTCLAAADMNQDGNVTETDLDALVSFSDEGVEIPALAFSPNLPCSHSRLRFGAHVESVAGSEVRIQSVSGEGVEADLYGPPEGAWLEQDDQDIYVTNPATSGHVTVQLWEGERSYYYTYPTVEEPEEESFEVVNDEAEEAPADGEEESPSVDEERDNDDAAPEAPIPTTCPQEGKGCLGLILDFKSKNGDRPFRYRPLPDSACQLTYHAPSFKKTPEVRVVKTEAGGTRKEVPTRKAYNAANTHNADAWELLETVIATYLNEVPEKDAALEVILAHGSGLEDAWTLPFAVGQSRQPDAHEKDLYPDGIQLPNHKRLSRADFHQRVHDAIDRKVCMHLAFDASCFSGSTVARVQALNNSNAPLSEDPSIVSPNHEHHAAWKNNIAASTASEEDTCTGTQINRGTQHLNDLFKTHGTDWNKTFLDFKSSPYLAKHYLDHGYGANARGQQQCTEHEENLREPDGNWSWFWDLFN